jgi:dynein light chain roadblock-type
MEFNVPIVEETVRRISSQPGVTGILICNNDGVLIRTTMEIELATEWAGLATQLARKGRQAVKATTPDDDLYYLRLRTKQGEIMIAPGFNQELTMVVLQKPVATA